jgi:hypothetical protein
MKFFLSSLGLGFRGSVNAFPGLLFPQRAEPALDAAHKFYLTHDLNQHGEPLQDDGLADSGRAACSSPT